jgi:macrodomain Ter protein organizer (MatP/YcbG family)
MAFVWLVPLVADFAAWLRLILHQEQFQATLNETTTQFIDSSGK